MKILFIRHGKAEDRSNKVSEFDRQLTSGGRDKLEGNMPYLRDYLSNFNFKVFSSPLTRAVQTAEYLQSDIQQVDFLATGNLSELFETIEYEKDLELLVFVGHEPILSDWCFELTNEFIDVKKGMVLEIDYPDHFIRALKLSDYRLLSF